MSSPNKLEATAKRLEALATKYGIQFDRNHETEDVWFLERNRRRVAYIMTHAAHMRIASGDEVEFSMSPLVTEEFRFVFLVTATKGNRSACSIGEAWWGPKTDKQGNKMSLDKASQRYMRPFTTSQSYVASMAEKRGKDRALQQLLGLDDLYSEDEADSFRRGAAPASSQPPAPKTDRGGTPQGGTTGKGPLGGGQRRTLEELGGERNLLYAISAGYDPELDPFKMPYKFSKHKGRTWADVYLNEGHEDTKDFTAWMAEQLNPWRKRGADEPELTEFTVKMWQAHVWLLCRINKGNAEVIPLGQCKFAWVKDGQAPAVQPLAMIEASARERPASSTEASWMQPPPDERPAPAPARHPVDDDLGVGQPGAAEPDPFSEVPF